MFAKLRKAHPGAELRVCYEAGPTGFVLARRLGQLKTECTVVAPSLIPMRAGDRIKTDRRDAMKLARWLHGGWKGGGGSSQRALCWDFVTR